VVEHRQIRGPWTNDWALQQNLEVENTRNRNHRVCTYSSLNEVFSVLHNKGFAGARGIFLKIPSFPWICAPINDESLYLTCIGEGGVIKWRHRKTLQYFWFVVVDVLQMRSNRTYVLLAAIWYVISSFKRRGAAVTKWTFRHSCTMNWSCFHLFAVGKLRSALCFQVPILRESWQPRNSILIVVIMWLVLVERREVESSVALRCSLLASCPWLTSLGPPPASPFIKRTWLETHGQQNNLPDQMKLASIKFWIT